MKSREWIRIGTTLTEKSKWVALSVSEQWKKTNIPHEDCSTRNSGKRVELLITSVRNFKKGRGVDMNVAKCKCPGQCTCSPEDQVPPVWKQFLEDQRGERKMAGFLSSRKLSLRGAAVKDEEDRKRKADIELKMEKKEDLVTKKKKQEEKSKKELDEQFKMVNLDEVEFSDSDTDEEWEDMEEEGQEKEKKRRNRKQLPVIAEGCDRARVPDRVGALIANCALIEYGIITPEDTFHVIDPSKLRRQRLKWGNTTGQKNKEKAKGLAGLYGDGKRSPTLVRKTKETKVATGKRGRGSSRVVTSVSNEVETLDHFPILGMPGAQFLTHVTPEDGCGVSLAKELEAVVRELDMPIKVIGMMAARSTQDLTVEPSGCLSSSLTPQSSGSSVVSTSTSCCGGTSWPL